MSLADYGLRKVFISQIALAILAVAVTIAAAFSVAPLFKQRAQLQQEVSSLKQEVAANSALLQESSNLLKSAHKVNFMASKHLYETSPCAARVLSRILEAQNQNVRWRMSGGSPEEGFDSPRFAAYMLEQAGTLSEAQYDGLADQSISGAQQRLVNAFHATQSDPSDGDLVFYKSGYTMFYFRDFSTYAPGVNPQFVAGMTPFGIAALDLHFADIIGVAHINYPQGSCR